MISLQHQKRNEHSVSNKDQFPILCELYGAELESKSEMNAHFSRLIWGN